MAVSQERLIELVVRAIVLAYSEDLPVNMPFTPESIGATEEEFMVLNGLLLDDEIFGTGGDNARS